MLLLGQMESPQPQTWYGAALGTLLATALNAWYFLLFLLCLSKKVRGWRKRVEDWWDEHDLWAREKAREKAKNKAEQMKTALGAERLVWGEMVGDVVEAAVKKGLEEERRVMREEMEGEMERRKGEWVEKGRVEEEKRQAERAKRMDEHLKVLGVHLETLKSLVG